MQMRVRKITASLMGAILASVLLSITTQAHATEKKITSLRVCSDPGNMPLSNIKGEGYENKIAEILAESLGVSLDYFWRPTIERGLTRKTFGEGKCDVMMSVPANMPLMLTTQPYYRTTYVLVHRNDKNYDIKTLDEPFLKEAAIGVFQRSAAREALRRHGIKQNTIVHAMSWVGDLEEEKQPHQQVSRVTNGELDMAAVWGSFAGYHKVKLNEPLTLVPMNVLDDTVYLQFDMSIGVDQRKEQLVRLLNEALVKEKNKILNVLEEFGVPLVKCDSCLISGNLPEHGPYGDITRTVDPGPGDGDVDLAQVEKWLAEGADINQELNNAVIADDMPRIQFLLEKGADINARDAQGYTPLTNALRLQYLRVSKMLIEKGADIRINDANGWPPLLLAAMKNDLKLVKLLVESKADLTAKNHEGLSVLHVASEFGSPEMVSYLIDQGVDVNIRNKVGYTPLMLAVAKHSDQETTALLDRGADVNAENNAGVTALMIAVAGKNKNLTERLIRAGARIDAETSDGQSAITIAKRNGSCDLLTDLNC